MAQKDKKTTIRQLGTLLAKDNTTMWYTNTKSVRYTYQVKDNELVFKFELAGKSKEDVKVYNKYGALVVKVDGKDYFTADTTASLRYDQEDYNFNAAKASMSNGLLTVTVPKVEIESHEIKVE